MFAPEGGCVFGHGSGGGVGGGAQLSLCGNNLGKQRRWLAQRDVKIEEDKTSNSSNILESQ